MELLQLRYFRELAQSEHLTNTANKLMISPPSLSQTIAKLETELGVKLFDRNNKKICLNNNGRIFLEYVTQALNSIDTGLMQMHLLADQQAHKLSVAINGLPLWYNILSNFRLNFPSVQLSYEQCTPDATGSLAATFCYDFYLGVLNDINVNIFEYRELAEPEIPVVLISRNHPFAQRKVLSLAELKNTTFITLGSFNPSSHKYLMDLCHIAGFEPENVLECDYYFRSKLIADGKGIGISTDRGYQSNALSNPNIKKIPVYGPYILRTQIIAWKKDQKLNEIQKSFLSFATNNFTK